MIAPSLYADLAARGVRLSIAPTPKGGELPPLRLRVRAPEGALTPALREAVERHRDALLAHVFDLEERAAVLEYEQGHTREEAERLARACVVGGTAGPDGRLWLRDLAEHHPAVKAAAAAFGGLEIVEVRRAGEAA